jgi:hypothetical protein
VERFDLVEVVESIRAELSEAARRGEGADIQLPVEGVELQFQVDLSSALATEANRALDTSSR